MRKSVFGIVVLALLASCTSQKPLYSWEDYETTSYNYLKNADEESIREVKLTYQEMIKTQEGTRGVVPPGICADYGFILLQEGKTDEAKEMLKKEVALYPESAVFINRILTMIEE